MSWIIRLNEDSQIGLTVRFWSGVTVRDRFPLLHERLCSRDFGAHFKHDQFLDSAILTISFPYFWSNCVSVRTHVKMLKVGGYYNL